MLRNEFQEFFFFLTHTVRVKMDKSIFNLMVELVDHL